MHVGAGVVDAARARMPDIYARVRVLHFGEHDMIVIERLLLEVSLQTFLCETMIVIH